MAFVLFSYPVTFVASITEKRFNKASSKLLRSRSSTLEAEQKDIWYKNDSVAQLVEQYTFNVWVLGSNPSGITSKNKALPDPLILSGLSVFVPIDVAI
jgi:hypothetical protein